RLTILRTVVTGAQAPSAMEIGRPGVRYGLGIRPVHRRPARRGIRARAGRPVGHVPVARPCAARSQRDRGLVAPPRRVRQPVRRAKAGAASLTAWYYNLKANPKITVEVGTQTFTALVEELDDTARAELWPKLVAESPTVGEHQAKTTRQVPVFILTRRQALQQHGPAR